MEDTSARRSMRIALPKGLRESDRLPEPICSLTQADTGNDKTCESAAAKWWVQSCSIASNLDEALYAQALPSGIKGHLLADTNSVRVTTMVSCGWRRMRRPTRRALAEDTTAGGRSKASTSRSARLSGIDQLDSSRQAPRFRGTSSTAHAEVSRSYRRLTAANGSASPQQSDGDMSA